MISSRSAIRLRAFYLFLVALLLAGIIQWSFLPVLIQTPSMAGDYLLDSSSWHTSKFAAPYKFFGVDSTQLFAVQTAVVEFEIAKGFSLRPAPPPFLQSAQFASERQQRSPPSL
jgi:hypothetical protein